MPDHLPPSGGDPPRNGRFGPQQAGRRAPPAKAPAAAPEPLTCRCGVRLGNLARDGRWLVLVAWTATGQVLVRDAKIVCWSCEKVTWFQARKTKDVARLSKP